MKSRKLISFFMVSIMALNSLGLFIAYSNFKVQQSRIAEEHCINKEKTDFDCGGQCFFMKKMAESQNSDSTIPGGNKIRLTFSPVYFENNTLSQFFKDWQTRAYPPAPDLFKSTFQYEIFRPPRLS